MHRVHENAISVTGRGGRVGCEMSRIPHCLDNRLTDGGQAISLTHAGTLYSPKVRFIFAPGTRFC
jgi:hypothetical protein